MSDLGQQLKDARLARGLSLDDVQEMTKIRKRYLEAIEAGDFKVLPGSFYVRAFIKTYAEAVGLSADELLQEHPDAVPEPEEQDPVMEPVVPQRRAARRTASTGRSGKLLSTILMWTFPILILVLVWVFVIKNNASPQIAETDPTPQQETTAPSTTTPNTTTPPASSGESTTPPASDSTTPPTGAGTEQDQSGADDTQTDETAAEDGTSSTSSGPVITEAGKEGRNTIFNVNYTGSQPLKVDISASGQSWLEVYGGSNTSGERLFYDNTSSGQNLSYDLTENGLYIKSGNSPATQITVNGQTITDGKATSRIVLKLVKEDASAAAGSEESSTDSDAAADTTTDSEAATTDSSSN